MIRPDAAIAAVVPATPVLSLTCATNVAPVLSWNAVDGGGETVSYDVQVYQQAGGGLPGNWVWYTRWTVTTTSKDVDIRDAKWRVVARTSAGASLPSNEVREGPLNPPNSASLSFDGTSAGVLTWSGASDTCNEVTGYSLSWMDLSIQYRNTRTITGNVQSTSLSPLQVGHAYQVRISTVSSRGTTSTYGEWTFTAANPPAAPVLAATGRGGDSISLAWDAPANNGAYLVDFAVQYAGADGVWLDFQDAVSTTLTRTVTGLTPGASYKFRVSARNSMGSGPWSNVVTGTVATKPQAPAVALVKLSGTSMGASWSVANNGGSPVTGFTVSLLRNGQAQESVQLPGTSLERTFNGLAIGSKYTVSVSATNSEGTSPSGVSPAVLAADAPGAPTVTVGAYSANTVTLRWNEPNANGAAITDYRIEYAGGDGVWRVVDDGISQSTEARVTGLTTGQQYRFRVAATSEVGTGTPSAEVSEAPSVAPTAPTVFINLLTSSSLQVRWYAAAANGAAIKSYELVLYQGTTPVAKAQAGADARAHTFASLRSGVEYNVGLAAVNRDGQGAQSKTFPVMVAYVAADWKTPLAARSKALRDLEALKTSVGEQAKSVDSVADSLFETEATAKRVAAATTKLNAQISRICSARPKPKGC